MGAKFGIGLLTLAMLVLVTIVAMACGASSAVVDTAATEQPSNPGPKQVTLGDGPVLGLAVIESLGIRYGEISTEPLTVNLLSLLQPR